MELDLSELERRAKAATPGKWTWKQVGSFNTPGCAVFWPDTSKGGVHYRRLDSGGGMLEDDANFIAAANPDVVLELVRRLQEAEKDAVRLDFLESNQLETDSAGDWNEEPTFGVHRVSGGRNDRNWHCLGRGETLRAAIDAAMQSPKNGA